ncbi:MAG: hypothetical protein K8H86_04170, partial [Ignavibacteriaceae bacterium]|nr:hypothetical protein [Ignavibacteriaceae bacterium]
LNTLSFIMEGLNGADGETDNIKHRAEGQETGMRALLEYSYLNKDEIKKTVNTAREKLKLSRAGADVAIRMDHAKGKDTLLLNLRSVYSGKDSLITVTNYNSAIEPLLTIKKPAAYLIPKADSLLVAWMNKHEIEYKNFVPDDRQVLKVYNISVDDSLMLEGDKIAKVNTDKEDFRGAYSPGGYFIVPINQLYSNMLVLALEPQSIIGLVVYKEFKYLLSGKTYPVLRVEN